MYCTIRY